MKKLSRVVCAFAALLVVGPLLAQIQSVVTYPGGSSGQLQYNNGGRFGGVPTVTTGTLAGLPAALATLNTSTNSLRTDLSAEVAARIAEDFAKGASTRATNIALTDEIARAIAAEALKVDRDTPAQVNLSTVTTALALKVDKNDPSQVNLSTVTTALAGKQATGNYITALTGAVTASGPGSVAATIVGPVPASGVDLSTVTAALALKAPIASPTFTGTVTTAEVVIGSNTFTPTNYALVISSGYVALDTWTESISTIGASGSIPASTIYWSSAAVLQVTLTNSPTWTFANAKAGQTQMMFIKQDGVGSRTITWPTIKWAANTAPTLTTTAGKYDIISFFYDGVDYWGFLGGQNY